MQLARRLFGWVALGAALAWMSPVVALAFQTGWRDRLHDQQVAAHEDILRQYQARVPLGWTRKQVEAYLSPGMKSANCVCGAPGFVGEKTSIYLGAEVSNSWACETFSAYVNFNYKRSEPSPVPSSEGLPSDVLHEIDLYRVGLCL